MLSTNRKSARDLRASGMMLAAVSAWSLVPLLLARGGGLENPFLFNTAWRTGVALSALWVAWLFFRPAFLNCSLWRAVRPRLAHPGLPMGVLNSLQYAVFAWSLRYVDVSIAAVLLESWPILLVIFLYRLMPGDFPRRRLRDLLPMLALGFAGAVLVVASRPGGLRPGNGLSLELAAGVFLAVLASVLGALDAFTFRWGRDLAGDLLDGREEFSGFDRTGLTLLGSVVAYSLASLPGAALSCVVGLARGEFLTPGMVAWGMAGGLTLQGVGNFLFRRANLDTANPGVNALGYLTPALSLMVLALFAGIRVGSVEFLALGTALVVMANLFISLKRQDGRFGILSS